MDCDQCYLAAVMLTQHWLLVSTQAGVRLTLTCYVSHTGSPHGSTQIDQALKEPVHVTIERSVSVCVPSSAARGRNSF